MYSKHIDTHTHRIVIIKMPHSYNTSKSTRSYRRSDKESDKRHTPKDRLSKGSHIATKEEWEEASRVFMTEKDYYV